MKFRFHEQSCVSGIETSFLESKLRFLNRNVFSGIKASFQIKALIPEMKHCIRKWSIVSGNEASISNCDIWQNFVTLIELYAYNPRHWNTGLVSSGISLTSWGGASLALVGHSTVGITTKIPYGVDVLLNLAPHLYLLGWLKLNLTLLLDQLRLA